MRRILLIMGESKGSQNVFIGVSQAECSPLPASDLAAAHELLDSESPNLVMVDLGLRSTAGNELAEFLEACRGENPPVPILALLPTSEPEAQELALEADDLVIAPYRPGEIALRLRRLLHRAQPDQEDGAVIRTGGLTIDLARYEAVLDNRRLDLTFKEYELLRFLASSPGKVFTRETLLNRVWGYDYFGGTRTVDVHIRRLRSKIETTTQSFIETVRNVGYRFREP